MGQHRLKWGQVKKYFESLGYSVYSDGGDKIISAPSDGKDRSRQTIRIGHTSSKNSGTEVLKCYESKIRHAFNIDPKKIKDA